MPESFLIRVTAELGIDLPPRKYYGVGMVYLPTDETLRSQVKSTMMEVRSRTTRIVICRAFGFIAIACRGCLYCCMAQAADVVHPSCKPIWLHVCPLCAPCVTSAGHRYFLPLYGWSAPDDS